MMRVIIFGALLASAACVALAATDVKTQVARPIAVADVNPEDSCVSNATHCTCLQHTHKKLMKVPNTNPQMCVLDPVEYESHKCSCPGNALCERLEFSCEKLETFGDFNELGQVACTEVTDATCFGVDHPEPCSENVNVFVDGTLAGCVRNIPVASNVDDAYGYGDAKAQNVENVEFDRINIRLIETTVNNDLHMCMIYGNWKVGEASHTSDGDIREVRSKISAGFPLNFEIKDDPSDQYFNDGTPEIGTFHRYWATKSDGFCLGPLLGDGSGFRAEFYDLKFLHGLNVQTYNEATGGIDNLAAWTFADHQPATDLLPDGRADGDESVVVEFRPTCSC
mmetsp:Transcript_17387/g.37750  ORF Transcript_17387/g.37750 Transcript_17387/m.37750 type:complete len:338 (+) Transcript_17387:71-1084(+)